MSNKTIVINDVEYIFDSVNIDYARKKILIKRPDRELNSRLLEWLKEGLDSGKGLNENYKKDIAIYVNNNVYRFSGCWVERYTYEAEISYDSLENSY